MIQIGSGRSWVAMDWHFVGEDLYVSIIGGETPHIGAAALAHRESGRMDVHTLSVPGHREEALTRFCAGRHLQSYRPHSPCQLWYPH